MGRREGRYHTHDVVQGDCWRFAAVVRGIKGVGSINLFPSPFAIQTNAQ